MTSALVANTRPAQAKTFIDTEVYGDKELKIATVNKLKQKLRNAINADETVAADLLKLAINDALGYDISDESGGPNGSVNFEKDRDENKSLKKAIDLVNQIKKELLRTNTCSLADIVAFGGAEALETVGCPRVTVQVGRADAKVSDTKSNSICWQAEEGILPENYKSVTLNAFKSSGLDARDIVLILGGLGEINRVSDETRKDREAAAKTDDDDESFEPEPFVPSSFGARDAMYGAKMGKADFGGKYFQSILKGKTAKNDPFGRLLVDEPAMKALVQKYATNELAFKQELAEAYLKMTLLGAAYSTRNS